MKNLNSKSEFLNPKQIQNTKSKYQNNKMSFEFCVLNLGFLL